ncbi:glycosyltransferase [Leptolyngbyaceae cyanobacterium CCMR0082]|uniref:Glycosyltransferase n=1 Tax=Adonisia turfae CCMR0082 TaxID=2304604 RepID=A0A6M0SBB6_9CYAN|nr:glycosyltransferase [Adonisia turfae]NEZ65798.1 glycosyltransferase [Adonisia turfae CCMR0082]
MKVLFSIPSIGSVYGGPSKTVTDLAQALNQKYDVLVDIVTTNANGNRNLSEPLQQWLSKSGYRIQYFPYISCGDYKWSNSFASWLDSNISQYDVVHTNAIFSLPNIPVYLACKKYRIPYVITPHGMLEPWAFSYKAWKKKLFYNLLEKPALNRASAIQALATPEAEHIKRLNVDSPISVIPNGIHKHDFESSKGPELFYKKYPELRDKKNILFLGRIDPKKGLDLLAKAFGRIHPHFLDSHLIIAGPDNIGFLAEAQKFFKEQRCEQAVTFTGMLTGSLKESALAVADIYVAPSYSEGFSMSILEGMASGLPCIITKGCNFPEAHVANAAYVVDIESNAIAEALTKCLENPASASEVGKHARHFILENYTWDKVAEKMMALYRTIQPQINSSAFKNNALTHS